MKKIQALVIAIAVLAAVSVPFSVSAKHTQLTRAELEAQVTLLTSQVAALEARVKALEAAAGIQATTTPPTGGLEWKCEKKGKARKNCQKGG